MRIPRKGEGMPLGATLMPHLIGMMISLHSTRVRSTATCPTLVTSPVFSLTHAPGCWQRAKVFSPKLFALSLLRDRSVSEENTEWNGNDYNTGHLTPINLASRERLETYTFLERQRSRSCVSLLDLVSDMSHVYQLAE